MRKPTIPAPLPDRIGSPIGESDKVLYLGNARLCELETAFDAPFRQILEEIATNCDARTIRTCLSKGLAQHHAGEDTEAAVDALIDEVGIAAVAAAIVAEFNFSMGGMAARRAAA